MFATLAAEPDRLDDRLDPGAVAGVPVRRRHQRVDLEQPAGGGQVGALEVVDGAVGAGDLEHHLLPGPAVDGDALGLAGDVDLEAGWWLDRKRRDVRPEHRAG